jgi:DNA-binding response OmpR family regulator
VPDPQEVKAQTMERRILIVDDDEAIHALLLTILKRRGFAVDTARNGLEDVDLLNRCAYVLMLLDLMMPQMNGWEVLEHVEKLDAPRRPVVIVLTAGTEPRDLNPDLVAGTVHKPFDVELLLDMAIACVTATAIRTQLAECPPSESDQTNPETARPKLD